MFKINENYLKLPGSYLFSAIAKKVAAYEKANPDRQVIRLGIGDVTLPIAPAIVEAIHKAADEMGHAETFHGYAPDLGYASCVRRLWKRTTSHGGAMWRQTRYSYRTEPKATAAISRRYSARTAALRCVTPYILCMWIPMLWQAAQAVMTLPRRVEQCDLHALYGAESFCTGASGGNAGPYLPVCAQ